MVRRMIRFVALDASESQRQERVTTTKGDFDLIPYMSTDSR